MAVVQIAWRTFVAQSTVVFLAHQSAHIRSHLNHSRDSHGFPPKSEIRSFNMRLSNSECNWFWGSWWLSPSATKLTPGPKLEVSWQGAMKKTSGKSGSKKKKHQLSDENIMERSNDPIYVIYVNRFKLGPFPDLTGNWEKISVAAQ